MRKPAIYVVAPLLIGLLIVAISFSQPQLDLPLKSKRIAMIVAHNAFRDEEFQVPYQQFISKGANVTVASSKLGELTGMLGLKIKPDVLVSDLKPEKIDALVIVGGVGAREYWHDRRVHQLAREVLKLNKIVAAICISPVTLAYAGILKGKKATVWLSERNRIIAEGAIYTGRTVQVDGLIVTGNGPAAAAEFADAITRLLTSIGPVATPAKQPAKSPTKAQPK